MNSLTKCLVAGVIFLGSACAYDNAEDLYGKAKCPPGGASFSVDIQPIISTNCAVSTCHVNGQQPPVLGTHAQIAAHSNKIKEWTGSGIMPPSSSGFSLTTEEIDLIACWVDAGSPNN